MDQQQVQQATERTAIDYPATVAVIDKATNWLQDAAGSANRAKIALSGIKAINSPEEDEAAALMLKKAHTTYTALNTGRAEITKVLDEIKAKLMEPEKVVSILPADKASEYNRVKNLRTAYAQKVAADNLKREQEARRSAGIANEKARVKKAKLDNISIGLAAAITQIGRDILAYIQTMTLENWESKLARFNITPKLKEQLFSGFLEVPYNPSLLTEDDIRVINVEVLAEMSYEKANAMYVKEATAHIEQYKKSLPERKKALEEIAAAAPLEAESKLNYLQSEDQEQTRLIEQQAQLIVANAQAATTEAANSEILANELQAQAAVQQEAIEVAGARKSRVAVIASEPGDIVKTLSKVLLECYKNPKFKGHLKTDRAGNYVGDQPDGTPTYADWAAHLLNFVAKEHTGEIEGITFKDKVTSTLVGV